MYAKVTERERFGLISGMATERRVDREGEDGESCDHDVRVFTAALEKLR